MSTAIAVRELFLLAQTGAGPSSEAVRVQSVWDFVVKGGPVMIPIAVCSLIALALIVERLISLRRSRVIPPDFLPGLRRVLAEHGTDPQAALEHCRRHPSPVARIFAAGMKHLQAPAEVLDKHISDAGEREVFKLRRFLRGLAVIGSIAPLLGLLGTITGMIKAFQTVAVSAEALGKTELLATGIYEALITTAAGLLLAIPVLVSHHWISARIESLVGEMDHMTAEFIEECADLHGRTRLQQPYIPSQDGAALAGARSVAAV